MELEKLKQEKIDAIDFAKKIDKETENVFIDNYQKLSIDGLTKVFFIDLEIFKEILENNQNKKFCKFYYIQKSGSLNLGLSFSDNDECPLRIDDKKYILNDKSIIKEDFTNMKNDFVNGIGTKLPVHPENKKDTLISYSLQEIDTYLKKMEDLHASIYALKFNMFQYSPTSIDHEFSAHFTARDKRIAFCVHALFNKSKDSYDESDGYDLGNLRP